MLLLRKVGWFYSGLSFLAAFFFTNGFFELKCMRNRSDDSYEDALWELTRDDLNVNFTKNKPRDEVVFSIEPWRVKQGINGKAPCSKTTKKNLIKIVVFIKSAAGYHKRRQAIRETWGRLSHIENVVIYVVFVVGSTVGDDQWGIDGEHTYFGDILQYIGVDDYRHIVFKVLAGLQWAKKNLPQDYFYATADDDLSLNLNILPKEVRRHIKRIEKANPTAKNRLEIIQKMPILCVYSYRAMEPPVRNLRSAMSKYYLDPKEYTMDVLPPFCLGGWYMMPAVSASQLFDITRTEKVLPMDDVWLTGVLRQKLDNTEIEALDSSCLKLGASRFAIHFKGDTDESTPGDILRGTIGEWKVIERAVKKKRHCIR